jgi:hypothetical protein
MARFLVVFLLFLVVAGGGTAAWWFGLRGGDMPFVGAGADDPGAEPEAEPTVPATSGRFVELAPLTFPVVRNGQVRELRTLVVSIELADRAAYSAVTKYRPKLRDALLSELHALFGYRFVAQHEDPIPLVKRRLLKAGRGVVGDGLRGVYLQAVQNQTAPVPAEQAEG